MLIRFEWKKSSMCTCYSVECFLHESSPSLALQYLPSRWKKFSKFRACVFLTTQTRIQCVPGLLSTGIKRPGREANHSPPSSAEVKNAWGHTSTSPYAFMEWCLMKPSDTFTCPFIDQIQFCFRMYNVDVKTSARWQSSLYDKVVCNRWSNGDIINIIITLRLITLIN
jgi:hypothetical protein